MAFSRRRFLNALGSTVGTVVVAPWMDDPFWRVQPIEAAVLSIGDFKVLVDTALDRAQALSCSFAGLLIERRHDVSVSMRVIPKDSAGAWRAWTIHVPDLLERESLRVGVRVIHAGVSGYAEGSSLDEATIALLTERAVASARADRTSARSTVPYPWIAPRLTDPSEMARKHRLAFREEVNRAVRERTGVTGAHSPVTIRGEHTCCVSTRGNCTHLTRVWEA